MKGADILSGLPATTEVIQDNVKTTAKSTIIFTWPKPDP